MLYALVSIGQRKQRSRWSDSEETLPLTQLKPQHNGTWRIEDELTTPPCATERTNNATGSGGENVIAAQTNIADLVAIGVYTIPDTIMVDNDLYETQDADECDTGHIPSACSSIDSDSSSDCADAACYNAPPVRDDISSLSGEVASGDGQLSASDEDQCPSLTPLDQEVAWRPFHDYDVVYTPRSDAGAMVRRVDSTGYVKSKLQRNHAYEEVRVDRTADGSAVVIGALPPCMSASPALPPRRTPAASPALPPRMTPETSSRRTPSASPALPPRWLPRAMSPAADEHDLASPPLPPRGSSHTPAAERATPRPPRRSTSVPSSPVAPHPSPPPIPLPPTPPVMQPRTTTGRACQSGQSAQMPTEPLSPDSDDSFRSDEEHDYDAVTASPADNHDDLADHRYSVVDDHVEHRYSASSTESESSNRDNVYEQINFEPT